MNVFLLIISYLCSVLAFSRETELREICYIDLLYMYTEGRGKIYFKELAHMILGAGKSEVCRADQQSGNSGNMSQS